MKPIFCFLVAFIVFASARADDNLVVRGVNEHEIQQLTQQLIRPASTFSFNNDNHIARWMNPVCVDIMGLPEAEKQKLQSYLFAAFTYFNIDFRKRCILANTYIFVTPDSDTLMSRILKREPHLSQGIDADERFRDNFIPPSDALISNLKKP
ncbi:hypothetical protein [Gluconobacter morbifer]|nr:hypothetical protein [Gluconobacter morbifer]